MSLVDAQVGRFALIHVHDFTLNILLRFCGTRPEHSYTSIMWSAKRKIEAQILSLKKEKEMEILKNALFLAYY